MIAVIIVIVVAVCVAILVLALPHIVLWILDKRLQKRNQIENASKCPDKVEKVDDNGQE